MTDALAMALGWGVAAIAFFSYLGVRAWVDAQRREREAYYRAEAIKKVAEMRDSAPESVAAMLREALKPPAEPPNPFTATPAVAREFYRTEMMKEVANSKAGADGVLAVMREEELRSARRTREGLKLGGLILTGVGAALAVFLRAILPDMPVYFAGLIPAAVGAAMVLYVLFLAPRA